MLNINRWLALFGLLCIPVANATDNVAVQVMGNIITTPCDISPDTVSKQVNLGRITLSNLVEPQSHSAWMNFNLDLSRCPVDTNHVTVVFSGLEDTQDTTAFRNTGTATNVALRLASRDRTTHLGNGSSIRLPVNATDRTVTFPLAAMMFTPTGGATRGTFSAAVTVTFIYQ